MADARESFLDVRGRLRPEAKRLRTALPSTPDATVVLVCEAVLGYLAGRWTSDTYGRVLAASGLSGEQLQVLFGGLLVVARAAARSRCKAGELAADMERELRMSRTAASAVGPLLAGLQRGAGKEEVALAKVARLEWRVEVTVSSSSLSRVMRPVLLMAVTDDKGEKLMMECSRETFQRLRHQVATALKTCEDTAALPILKIE